MASFYRKTVAAIFQTALRKGQGMLSKCCIKHVQILLWNRLPKGMNDNTSPFLIIEDKDKSRVGMASPSIEDSRVGVFTSGIFIKPEFQRKGYAKEALFMIMEFYFNQLRCRKFNVSVYSYNEPSNRLFEKIGLVVEGRRRNTVFTDGTFYDEILYGLTKDEFSELVK